MTADQHRVTAQHIHGQASGLSMSAFLKANAARIAGELNAVLAEAD